MGYLFKAVAGLSLFLGGIIVFNLKLVELIEVGTCASGNVPFEISKPCPEGVGSAILLVNASVLGGVVGAIMFALRGEPPWASGRKRRRFRGMFGFGAFAWGFFFTATGANMLQATFSSDTIGADGELGGRIVAGTFLFMGVPALLAVLVSGVGHLRGGGDRSPARADEGAGIAPAGGALAQMRAGLERAAGETVGRLPGSGAVGPGPGGGTIAQLERLDRLRESGALTQAEFDREKAKVLARQ